MKKFVIRNYKFVIVLVVFVLLLLPVMSFAASDFSKGLVPCGRNIVEGVPADNTNHSCGFDDVMTLINTLINYVIYLSIPIFSIMFAYAGFTLITAGGSEGKTKAKGIFTNAIIGFVVVLAAYLIVKTVLVILGYKDASWIGF
jgi:hypothetical protein